MKHLKKIKPYGDTDVTLQFKTHDQNLQVCLKWETKIMLKQLFSHQNKGKQNFVAEKLRFKFLNSTFFLLLLRYRLTVTFLAGISRKSAMSAYRYVKIKRVCQIPYLGFIT